MTDEAAAWRKRFERERTARKEAERLLELKSLELYEANNGLAEKVRAKTRDLRTALDEARAASKAKDRFLSSVSHELRTPLNAIMGFSQILAAKSDTPEEIRPYLEKIHISAKSLLNLVNSILDIAKLESGKMDFNPEAFAVNDLIITLRAQTEPQAAKKHLQLAFTGDSGSIYGDRQLLSQAVLNLITNAIKFSRDGTTVTVRTRIDPPKRCFELSVRDEGIGMSDDAMASLFQPFSQVHDKAEHHTGGTGLGLVIVQRIVDLHSGTISVESEPSQGTCFHIALPLETPIDEQAHPASDKAT